MSVAVGYTWFADHGPGTPCYSGIYCDPFNIESLENHRPEVERKRTPPAHALDTGSMGPLARERSFNVFVRGCERRRGYLVC